jgi:hypothetical protein
LSAFAGISFNRTVATNEDCIMNDKELRRNVIDELEFEPSIDSANIGVAAEGGVAAIKGGRRTRRMADQGRQGNC